jgi:hypothetical protein
MHLCPFACMYIQICNMCDEHMYINMSLHVCIHLLYVCVCIFLCVYACAYIFVYMRVFVCLLIGLVSMRTWNIHILKHFRRIQGLSECSFGMCEHDHMM